MNTDNNFNDFRERIIGKVYKEKYESNRLYLVADVLFKREGKDIDSSKGTAFVIYLKIIKTSDRSMTGMYTGTVSCLEICGQNVSFACQRELNELSTNYPKADCTLEDFVSFYKTTNGEFKSLMQNAGAVL